MAPKHPVFLFVLILGGSWFVFNGIFYLWIKNTGFLESYLKLYAAVCACILRWFGEGTSATGAILSSPVFSMKIADRCGGIQPCAFFVFVMLASPLRCSLRSRLVPIAIGLLLLLVMNVGRIVSLYYAGVYFPGAFDILHIDVWQAVFIFVPLLLWLSWVRWAARSDGVTRDVSS